MKSLSLANKHTFQSFQILQNDLAIMINKRKTAVLDRPIYMAFSVLEFAKLHLYIWHYDKIKTWYNNNNSLTCYTDTDSLIYQIKTKNIYADLVKHENDFDFSDYNPLNLINGFLYSENNRKVIGKMKDEAKGKILYSFVGIAPEVYSIIGESDLKVKKAKGVKSKLISNRLSHRHFKKSLCKQRVYVAKMHLIRSKNHQFYLGQFRKNAIHCFDSKRYILEDGISSRSHFHYRNNM